MQLLTFFTNWMKLLQICFLSISCLKYQPIVFSSDEIINTTGCETSTGGEKSTTSLSMKPCQRYKHRGCNGGVFSYGSAGVTLRGHTEPAWSWQRRCLCCFQHSVVSVRRTHACSFYLSAECDCHLLYVTSDVNVERRQLFVFCRDISERGRQHTEATYWSRSHVPSRHKIIHKDYRMLEALLLSRFIHVYWMFYSSIIERL